jgi:hypothetical protein
MEEIKISTEREDALIDILRQVKEVLDKYDVEFWLECGTLLGAVREGKFLSWECDIDFGSWHEEMPDTVKISVSKALCDRGFKVWIAENHINIKEGNGFWADINLYYLSNDKAIKPELSAKNLLSRSLCYWLLVLWAPYHPHGVSKSPVKRFVMNTLIRASRAMPSLLRKQLAQIVSAIYEKIGAEDVSWEIPSKYFSDLPTITFYGMELKVPAKTREYLAYRYGEDWHIPRRDWVTARDDGAAISSNRRKREGYHES